VYKMADLPAIGGGSSDAELLRLEEVVRSFISQSLPPKPAAPSPEFRPAHPAPTQEAHAAHQRHVREVVRSYRELLALTEKGIFRLPRAGDDDAVGGGGGSSSSSHPCAAKRMKTVGPRRIKQKESGMVGQGFEDDGTNWQVLDVAWSDEADPPQVVVYYFDADLAEAEGIVEEELLESPEESSDNRNVEHVEWPKVQEVVGWLRASARARRATAATPGGSAR